MIERIDVKYPDDDFFQYGDQHFFVCGECVKRDLQETLAGSLSGDEVVTENMVKPADPDESPFQCESCNKQSDDYDELIEDYD